MRNAARTMSTNSSRIVAFVILWSVAGFPLLAGLTSLLGVNNTTVSLAFRALAAVCAGYLIFVSSRQRADTAVLLFSLFWLAYFLRLLMSLHLAEGAHSRPAEEYWMWSIGACMLPALATFRAASAKTAVDLRMPLLLIALAAILLALSQGGTEFVQVTGQTTDINRWNLNALNPISTGHLGTTGVLLGISVLWTRNRSHLETVLALGAIPTGLILTLLANSRGPALALALCIFVLLLATRRHEKTLFMALIGLCLLTILAIFAPGAFSILDGLTGRFSAIETRTDLSTIGREIAFQGAIEQFLGAPIFGDGIEERITGYYPHNLVLEAFMATGIVGGIPFILLLLKCLRACWLLLGRTGTEAWIGLLALQYILAAQLSGSIYLSTAMWVTVPLALLVAREGTRSGHGA